MTNGEFVSTVVNSIRALNKDEHISRRYILSRGREKAKLYFSQKLSDGTLFKETGLFKTDPCVKLKEVDSSECTGYDFSSCKTIMKSEKKFEGLVYSRFVSSIVRVTTVDGSTEFIRSTKYRESFSSSLRGGRPKKDEPFVYYEEGGYIYLPNTEIEAISVTYITLEEDSAELNSDCEDCDNCKSLWDYTFTSSDRFAEAITSETISEVAGIWRRVQSDENPDMDSNIKSVKKSV